MTPDADVLVVGAGPAGLAAATELKALGVGRVVVLDRERTPGGIPRHCDHYPFGLREFRRLLRGPDYAKRLVDRALAAGVEIRSGATVTALRLGLEHSPTKLKRLVDERMLQVIESGAISCRPDDSVRSESALVVEASTPDGLVEIAARHVLLATGVREKSRAARLIGGTRPGGVIPTGALQGLVHLEGIAPFRRPVVVGTELVAFSALLTCRHGGIRPVAMVERGDRTTARWPSGWLPWLMGIPLHTGTEVEAIEGDRRVTGVVLRDRDGRTRRIEADGVIVTGAFQPESSLLRLCGLEVDPGTGGPVVDQYGRCSEPGVFAAGNLLRPVETAGWSWNEGRSVARAIAASLSGLLPPHEPSLTIATAGDPLKYAMPQRIATGGPDAALDRFQLRVTRAAKGRLVLTLDGRDVWSRPIDTLPERRINVPLSVVPRDAAGTATFAIREDDRP